MKSNAITKKEKKKIFHMIHELHGDEILDINSFRSAYIGALAFIYIDTYGLSKQTVWRVINEATKDNHSHPHL